MQIHFLWRLPSRTCSESRFSKFSFAHGQERVSQPAWMIHKLLRNQLRCRTIVRGKISTLVQGSPRMSALPWRLSGVCRPLGAYAATSMIQSIIRTLGSTMGQVLPLVPRRMTTLRRQRQPWTTGGRCFQLTS